MLVLRIIAALALVLIFWLLFTSDQEAIERGEPPAEAPNGK